MRIQLQFDYLESRTAPSIFAPPPMPPPGQQPLPVMEPELPLAPLVTVQPAESPSLLDSITSAAQAILQSAVSLAPNFTSSYIP